MNQSLKFAAVSVSSMLIGAGVGYVVAEKRLSARFDDRLVKETAEMRKFYTIGFKKYKTPEEAVAELIQPKEVDGEVVVTPQERVAYHKIVKTEYKPEDDPEEDLAIEAEVGDVAKNIFEEKVDPDRPYVVSQEDYMQNGDGFSQATLTYYEKDKVLTDEREDPIEDLDATVGEDNLTFGVGSSDPNSVHVRNIKLRMDFEVVRSEGSYAMEVLGMEETPMEAPRQSRRQRNE